MMQGTLLTSIPTVPGFGSFRYLNDTERYTPEVLQRLARERRPFWLRVDLRNPQTASSPPVDNSAYALRVPGVHFDVLVTGAATNLDLSLMRLMDADDTLSPDNTALAAMVANVTSERRRWQFATPLIVRAHRPYSLEIRYRANVGGLVNNTGFLVLEGIRLEKTS